MRDCRFDVLFDFCYYQYWYFFFASCSAIWYSLIYYYILALYINTIGLVRFGVLSESSDSYSHVIF